VTVDGYLAPPSRLLDL
jgi:hypothetical protein